MNAMRRIRLGVGILSFVLGVIFVLWFGVRQVILAQLGYIGRLGGLTLVSVESIQPHRQGVHIFGLHMRSHRPYQEIRIEHAKITFSLSSLWHGCAEFLQLKGAQYLGNVSSIYAVSQLFLEQKGLFKNYPTSYTIDGIIHIRPHKNTMRALYIPSKNININIPALTLLHETGGTLPLSIEYSTDTTHKTMNMNIDGSLISPKLSTQFTVQQKLSPTALWRKVKLHNSVFKRKSDTIHAHYIRLLLERKNYAQLKAKFSAQGLCIENNTGNAWGISTLLSDPCELDFEVRGYNHNKHWLLDGEGELRHLDTSAKLNLSTQNDHLVYTMQGYYKHTPLLMQTMFPHFQISEKTNATGHMHIHMDTYMPTVFLEEHDHIFHEYPIFALTYYTLREHKEGKLSVALNDLSYESTDFGYTHLNGQLNFSLFPMTLTHQVSLYAESLHYNNLIFSDIETRLSARAPYGILDIKAICEGSPILLHSVQHTPTGPRFFFEIKDLDLKRIAPKLPLENLQAHGTVSGRGHLCLDCEKGLRILNAKFFSTSPMGRLHYEGVELPEVGQAFRDLHFSMLAIELVPKGDTLQAHIDILGRTPVLQGGHAHRFHIETQGDLYDLGTHTKETLSQT